MKILKIIPIFTLFLLLGSSCEDSITKSEDIIFPEENVSYRYHVQPYLSYNCAFYGCHGINSPGTPINEYIPLVVNATGWVIPGNPDGSLLIQVLENPWRQHPVTNPPAYIPELDSAQVAGVRKWVEEGAQNN
jgi:hypothetical protein